MFGLSNYTTNWHDVHTQARVEGVSMNRVQEDFKALSDIFGGWKKFRFKIGGLWDAPLRDYTGEITAGGGSSGTFKNFRQEEIEAFNKAVEMIKPMLKRENTVLAVPLANGNHIDHFITKEAVIKAAYEVGSDGKATILFGQDQPYTGANPGDENIEINALRRRLPEGAITQSVYPLPIDDKGNTVKLNLYLKRYLTQYDEGYLEPLKNNTRETVYEWNPDTFRQVKSHAECQGDYCSLAD